MSLQSGAGHRADSLCTVRRPWLIVISHLFLLLVVGGVSVSRVTAMARGMNVKWPCCETPFFFLTLLGIFLVFYLKPWILFET